MATIIGNLDFWGHQEVMIKCDQEQGMKRIAELRPRRTIIEYSPKGSHQSNGVVENAHSHLEGLLRTVRSDLVEKTGVNVNVKSLLAPWLLRHCALRVEFDEICNWCGWANSFQASTWQRQCW